MADVIAPTLYFAYGSNLSLRQMHNRCPGSDYYGFGILHNYKWLINERGYANVVKSKVRTGKDQSDSVEGMLYTLTKEDEQRLDAAEGVPHVYQKHVLPIMMVESPKSDDGKGQAKKADEQANNEKARWANALVYVDVERVSEGQIREEYIIRMNRGIKDARGKGMSDDYIDRVLRNWIPAEGTERNSSEVIDPFLWQARGDEDISHSTK